MISSHSGGSPIFSELEFSHCGSRKKRSAEIFSIQDSEHEGKGVDQLLVARTGDNFRGDGQVLARSRRSVSSIDFPYVDTRRTATCKQHSNAHSGAYWDIPLKFPTQCWSK